MISVHQAEVQSTVLMAANGTTNGMPSWTANTLGNVFLVITEEIKTHNMSEFVAGINVNNGDVAERAINRCSCLFLCAEICSCTRPGPRYPCRGDCGGLSVWRRQTCNHPRNAGGHHHWRPQRHGRSFVVH